MTRYISEPIPVDRGSIRAVIDERAQDLLPGIDTTSPGTAYDFLADIVTGLHAEALTTLTEQLAISNRYGFEKIDRVSQLTATQATADATLVRVGTDTAERIVSAGTEFNLQGSDGQLVAFALVNDCAFAAADLSEAVELIAVLGGTGGNGLSTVIGPAQTLTWFSTLTVSGTTSGGEDGETDEEYLDRAADTRPLQAQAISKADDLARWLRNQSGVDRVLALDNYNADTSDDDAPGHITAIPIDEDGAALSGGTMTTLEAAAQEITLTNLIVHVIAPTKVDVDVVFVGIAEPGFDADDVNDRAEAAVLDHLNGARWGLPSSGDTRDWQETLIVYHQDISTVLNNVQGFARWTTLTIGGSATDFTLTGPGALPDTDSTCSGTTTL